MDTDGDQLQQLQRLQRLLGGPALAALRQRLRRAYEQLPIDAPLRQLRLGALQTHEREALATLLGRAPRLAASIQVDVALLDTRLLAAGLASGLRDALERLDGPISAVASQRAEHQASWLAVQQAPTHAGLREVLASAQGLGLLKRLARQDANAGQALCDQAQAVLQALPAAGKPRARLAAEQLGDAHALDDGRALATLVLAALRQARRYLASNAEDADDETRRALWASAGVSVNELARPALTLNLMTSNAPGEPGEPVYWSLRRLLRGAPEWPLAGQPVFVCENPNLVAIAADALGPRCAPLVCTDGMPAAAQRALLAQLAAAGAQLHYHGDFDWPGLAIAARVLADFGAKPWRMGCSDYTAALTGAPPTPLRGTVTASPWDPALSTTMQRENCAVAEEAVAGPLLADLDRP